MTLPPSRRHVRDHDEIVRAREPSQDRGEILLVRAHRGDQHFRRHVDEAASMAPISTTGHSTRPGHFVEQAFVVAQREVLRMRKLRASSKDLRARRPDRG
jgi:hypothetical protein